VLIMEEWWSVPDGQQIFSVAWNMLGGSGAHPSLFPEVRTVTAGMLPCTSMQY
jgi:hypothetical protein